MRGRGKGERKKYRGGLERERERKEEKIEDRPKERVIMKERD